MGHDLHRPEGIARAVALVLHPHPGMGGDRHHPLVIAVADGLAARGVAASRLDITDPDPRGAVTVLERAANDLSDEVGSDRLVLVGYSWGAAVSAATSIEGLMGRVLVAPPAGLLVGVPEIAAATLVLVPEHDQFGPPDAVAEATAEWSSTTVETVTGIDHFLVGGVDRIATRAVDWIDRVLV